MSVGIGLYGLNGHQVHHIIKADPNLALIATAGIETRITHREGTTYNRYDTLDEMLQNDRVDLVSLCSPIRRDQPRDAIKCLAAGRHVYAEKPSAFSEKELDTILETAERHGVQFHEMAGTAFSAPFVSMRATVLDGCIGEVIQIHAQKSYLYPSMPLASKHLNKDTQGGLLTWVGIHAVRMIEHTTGLQVQHIHAAETKMGSPAPESELRTACCFLFSLNNGALASSICNYLHRPWKGPAHNEALRIYGTKGFLETMDGGTRTRFVTDQVDTDTFPVTAKPVCYFHAVLDSIERGAAMPLTLEEELHPLRVVIRAKAIAESGSPLI